MNDQTRNMILVVLVVVAIGGYFFPRVGGLLGGLFHTQQESFFEGILAGTTDQLSISNTGAITTSGATTFSGTNTLSGATTVSGALTLTGGITGTGGSSALATTSAEAFTRGGDSCTLTDANGGAFTLTQELMSRCSTFIFAAGGLGQEVIQLTYPATSTLTTLIPNAGDCREYLYDSSALAAATTTTHTAAAGIIIIAPTVNDDLIDGGEYSRMDMCRKADTDVLLELSAELVDAD